MTVRRTLPSIFPVITEREVHGFKIWKSSLIRRIAMAQNFIWANFRRVYANYAYEGLGNIQFHTGTSHVLAGAIADPRSERIGNDEALPLCQFYCPPNWGASGTLKIQGRSFLATDVGPSAFLIAASVLDLDERETGIYAFSSPYFTDGTHDWSVELAVPQDKAYQIKVWQVFSDGDPGGEDSNLDERAITYNVSARYKEGTTAELYGDTPSTTWNGIHEDAASDNYPCSSALLKRLVNNINHLYCHRNPEVCQIWLDTPNANTSSWTEVGRYTVYLPDKISKIKGRMSIWCTHGGAGNEVRVLIDGTEVESFTALSSSNSVLDTAEYTGLTSGAEHTITIEAKSTAASANWGTQVIGVWFWESGLSTYLPTGMSAPAAYTPIDEEGIEGDDIVTSENNQFDQESGLRRLIQNDAWLFRNRMRWLIGDWRHRVYKRGPTYSGSTLQTFDQRLDYTSGALVEFQPYAWKNITIHGDSVTHDIKDSQNEFVYGDTEHTGYVESGPFIWPQTWTFERHGRRLGVFWMIEPSGHAGHISDQTGWVMFMRGRRLPPAIMSADANGYGPAAFDTLHLAKHYFRVTYDDDTNPVQAFDMRILGTRNPNPPSQQQGVYLPDCYRHWISDTVRSQHTGLAEALIVITGRQGVKSYPMPPDVYGTGATSEWQAVEGMIFETELNGVCIIDEPYNQNSLDAL